MCVKTSSWSLSMLADTVSVIPADTSRAKENHSKSFAFLFNWLSMLLPMSSTLGATLHTKWLIVLSKFVYSGQIPSAATIQHDLVNLPAVNGFPCLASKWASRKLAFVAALFSFFTFVKKFFCDETFHLRVSNFSDCSSPVSWEYCDQA